MGEVGGPNDGEERYGPAKRRYGRWSIAVELAILDSLRHGATRTSAAQAAGVSVDTLQSRIRRFPALRRACATAEAECMDRMARTVARAGLGAPAEYDENGNQIRAEIVADVKAAMWFLERRNPREWGQRIHVDVAAIARRMAEEHGLEYEAVMAEVDRIMNGMLADRG